MESVWVRLVLLVGIGAILMVFASYVSNPVGAILFILGALAVVIAILLLIVHLVRPGI